MKKGKWNKCHGSGRRPLWLLRLFRSFRRKAVNNPVGFEPRLFSEALGRKYPYRVVGPPDLRRSENKI